MMERMEIRKMNKPNECIKCAVNTCHYYGASNRCMAERIEIEPRSARSTEETGCVTFKLKS